MKTLKNKNGFSYIMTCVFILGAAMLIFIALQYAMIYHIANEQKKDTQLALDSYVTTYAVEKYNALKQGEAYDKYIDLTGLVDGAYAVLGYPRNVSPIHRDPIPLRDDCTMSQPTVNSLGSDRFGVHVTYELSIPFEAFGIQVVDVIVPVDIRSSFTEKY